MPGGCRDVKKEGRALRGGLRASLKYRGGRDGVVSGIHWLEKEVHTGA